MRLDRQFVEKVLPDSCIVQGLLPQSVLCAVDTRHLQKDQLFFAIQGAQVDGHDYLKEALEKGAGVVIAADKKNLVMPLLSAVSPDKLVILVKDPLQALVALATAWRALFSYPVAAITGSVGKTTTKELTAHMLQCAGKKYLVSQGNLNTLIGVAITIFHMDDSYEGALFEVGINKKGEMAQIVEMLKPTTGLITCIAHTHMEGLGTMGEIAAEKRMVFKTFGPENIGIVHGDQAVLSAVSYPYPVVRFGVKTTNQIQARKIKSSSTGMSFVLKLYDKKYPITLEQDHKGLMNNVLASTALAHQLGASDEAILKGIKSIPVRSQRFEVCSLKQYKGTMIDDCYNASPESVKAALLAFQSIETTGKKIAVLGDMLELGKNSPFWHRQIGRFLRRVPTLKHLILVGDQVKWIEKTAPIGITVEQVPSWQDAVSKLSGTLEDNAVVLVKGSRGMQLHNVVAAFAHK